MSNLLKNGRKPESRKTVAATPTRTESIGSYVGVSQSPASAPLRDRTVESKPGARGISTQAIAEAAYFLWLKRGGNDLVNWLEAETTLRNPSR